MALRIGIDVGGVLSQHDGGRKKSDASEHTNTAVNMPGALEAIRKLSEAGHTLVIVSFCGRARAYETRDALEGLPFAEQYYVKNRLDKGKICDWAGLDVLIDDREDVLNQVFIDSPHTERILFGSVVRSRTWTYAQDWSDVTDFVGRLANSTNSRMVPHQMHRVRSVCHSL